MHIDLIQLQQLIHIAENANIDELEVHDGEQTIRIVCHAANTSLAETVTDTVTGTVNKTVATPKQSLPTVNTTTVLPNSEPRAKPSTQSTPENATATPNQATITAPMIGTFYLRASPEATPFVAVNDNVTANQTLCIIEAMKIMHEVKAEKAGKITQILANESDMVEYGQPLFVIE